MRQWEELWIRKDFENWSGGFPPESEHQISVYIEHARPINSDPETVRQTLVEWMNQA